ncbi:MAG TPA: efflux RND transporter periplasmic adaptor subunit [bacterium]|nr:efflux RND transporter periplasmic adaptor subunit [bacterium]
MKLSIPSLLLAAGLFAMVATGCGKSAKASQGQKIQVTRGDLLITVQATGNVEPLNKVSILPPITGRIDKWLVDEGAYVKAGQILAWMSSSDRAALLDTARSESPDQVQYWEQSYKSTPIVSPSAGLIIARNIVDGQTVAADTDLYDLSDRLYVFADVDETDLGKIHMGQTANVTVDAYPNKVFQCQVTLIGHQAIKVNNVISYQINLRPVKVPGELRAGMTADINFIVQQKKDVLMLPNFAVKGQQEGSANVRVLTDPSKPPEKRGVTLGLSDGVHVEILDGLQEGDTVLVGALDLPKAATGGPMSMTGGGQRPSGGGGGGGGR